jgi:hypothetical protein
MFQSHLIMHYYCLFFIKLLLLINMLNYKKEFLLPIEIFFLDLSKIIYIFEDLKRNFQ